MRDQQLLFSELLCSRLCHDLITPIGAINTGLELFEEQTFEKSEETEEIIGLIQQSASTASARLGFYRAAFGGSGNGLPLKDVKRLVEKYFAQGKLKFSWESPFEDQLSLSHWCRILMNMILWVQECAPRGGTLNVRPYQTHLPRIELELEADTISLQAESQRALSGEVLLKDITPRTIQPYLLYLLAKDIDVTFELNQPTHRKLIFTAKKASNPVT